MKLTTSRVHAIGRIAFRSVALLWVVIATAGLAGCTPARSTTDVSAGGDAAPGRAGPRALHTSWYLLPDSARPFLEKPEFLMLSFVGMRNEAQLLMGAKVEGSYVVAGNEVRVVAAGDTRVARVPCGGPGGRTVPLIYEMQRDTLWWRGCTGAPVPVRALVPALGPERRLPTGWWVHDWPVPADQQERGPLPAWALAPSLRARLELSEGGCAHFQVTGGGIRQPYSVAADTLRMGFRDFLGIPTLSRYVVRGDTLQLDFEVGRGPSPEPVRLLFVRAAGELLHPAAQCAPPPGP